MQMKTQKAILYVLKETEYTSMYAIAKVLTDDTVKVQTIQVSNYLKGKNNMSEKVAIRFEEVFGITISDVYQRNNWSEMEKLINEV